MVDSTEIKDLEDKIRLVSQQYYENGTSPISDFEFDNLLAELKLLDPFNELLSTVAYGYKPSAANKFTSDDLEYMLVNYGSHINLRVV